MGGAQDQGCFGPKKFRDYLRFLKSSKFKISQFLLGFRIHFAFNIKH